MAFVEGMQEYIRSAPHLAYVAAFAGGVATSLTPCVYPIIPITVGYIGGRSAGSSPRRGLMLSLSYVLGLAAVYAALGAVAALTGSLFGQVSASPWTNLFIANVCIVMGLSMLGLFELQAPGFMRNFEPVRERGSLAGAFVIGGFSGLVAAPCTAPVLVAILGFVATKQNVVYGVSLLFSFAMGLGFLLVIVGTFAGALAALPKSGPWMVKVKTGFGIALIAVGEYFLIQAGKMFI